MRSRYSAFALGAVDYLCGTIAPASRRPTDRAQVEWSTRHPQWQALEVLGARTSAGGKKGTVEFVARYELEGRPTALHEVSTFARVGDRWYYVEGQVKSHGPVGAAPEAPAAPRGEAVGRNQPCPCGSGRKYKQCCLGSARK